MLLIYIVLSFIENYTFLIIITIISIINKVYKYNIKKKGKHTKV
jgi:hypothetical protein